MISSFVSTENFYDFYSYEKNGFIKVKEENSILKGVMSVYLSIFSSYLSNDCIKQILFLN